jgi:hypothetical protein
MEALMPKYSSNKSIFANKASAWCKQTTAPTDSTNQYKVLAGQCDWAYVAGLSETSDARWPLLATAFAPGTKTYVKSAAKQGGVWSGTDAVVVFVDHSAKQVELSSDATAPFIKRPDKPTANMFEKEDPGWLDGDTVAVLEPLTGGG